MTIEPDWRDDSAFTNWGPYADERAAQADAELRLPPLPHGTDTDAWRKQVHQAKRDFIRANLAGAGVTDLGEFDERIVTWLTTWEESTLQVILGWVYRANIAGASTAEDFAEDMLRTGKYPPASSNES